MSYSFSIVAKTKSEAKDKVEEEFSNVVLSQPIHASDRNAAQKAAQMFVDSLADPSPEESITVSVYGSVGWRSGNEITSANVSIVATLSIK